MTAASTRKSFWKDKTVLLTGATGFLGGWLARRLLECESRVVALVRKPRSDSQFYLEAFDSRCDLVFGNVYDRELIDGIFKAEEIDVVLHTAAVGDVNVALENPVECFRACIESTWSILDAIRKFNPECIAVVSSSDKAYGKQELPFRETQFLNPNHPYNTAKACEDLITQDYGKIYNLPVAVTRCGNYFGGYDFMYSRIIPGTIKSVLEGKRPVLRSDGRFTRDFLYVEDAVEVQLMLAEALAENETIRGEAFNFSHGVEIEVIDIVNTILKILGSDLGPDIQNNVTAETKKMLLSSEKAKQVLGWKPRWDFESALESTVKWYQDYFSNR